MLNRILWRMSQRLPSLNESYFDIFNIRLDWRRINK